MWKNLFKVIAIFVIGMIGGIFAEQIFWPYFIERPLFSEYRLERRPIILNETKEVVIQENTALKDAIEKVGQTVVGVRTRLLGGRTLDGSGLILTSDGLMITLAELIPSSPSTIFILDDKQVNFQVLKRDLKENLALIKLEGSHLSTAGFGDLNKLKIGERIFILGLVFEAGKEIKVKKITNEGIIKSFDDNFLQTNIVESISLKGAPIFDIQGNVLGISMIDREGKVGAISIKKIRDFSGI